MPIASEFELDIRLLSSGGFDIGSQLLPYHYMDAYISSLFLSGSLLSALLQS